MRHVSLLDAAYSRSLFRLVAICLLPNSSAGFPETHISAAKQLPIFPSAAPSLLPLSRLPRLPTGYPLVMP